MSIETLNNQFSIANEANFYSGNGGLPGINITNKYASASISLYGAHILSYQPAGQKDILWMSERSVFENGKAIRGGIPVCFPWFGPHSSDKTKPQHGFARLQQWEVTQVSAMKDGSTMVSLYLADSGASLELWPFEFAAKIDFIIGETLEVKLTVTNTGDSPFEYSDALHTYFNISSIADISIDGLQAATYYEGFAMDLKEQEPASLQFTEETNRRYVNHSGNIVLNDPGFNRKIKIDKTGSKVTVIWNPGETVTKTINDIAPEGFKNFVCAEPANAYPGIDMIELAPGESHTLATVISIIE